MYYELIAVPLRYRDDVAHGSWLSQPSPRSVSGEGGGENRYEIAADQT
jgi:hypothetical protein